MEIIEKADIDNMVIDLMRAKVPVKEALEINKKFDGRALSLMFRSAIESGNIIVANIVYKTMLLEKLHRVNYFIGLVQENAYSEYLEKLSLSERQDLLDDFILRLELRFGTQDDKRAFEILMESIEDNKSHKM